MSTTTPTLGKITRQNGVAGQYAYTVPVTYPGEDTSTVTFVGSEYGGCVVMVTEGNPGGMFVSGQVMDRCGYTLTPAWVRAFFGVAS